MEENVIDNTQIDHNALVESVIEKVKNNDSNYYFYCPPLNSPSGGIGVVIKLARILKDSGYNAKIVFEPKQDQRASFEESRKANEQIDVFEKFNPTWLDFNFSDIEFIPLYDHPIKKTILYNDGTEVPFAPLNVNPEDFFIIPEGFPNIMKKTMQIACKKIVLAQSWFYILNALNTGENWQSMGVVDVISVSEAITEYLKTVMPGLNIKEFSQGINRNIFKVPSKKSDKYPIIGFMGNRGQENQLKTFNIIKTFQAFYPHLRWVRFVQLGGLSRKDFAERLSSCAFVLYTDDIAGFGTLPLESMATGTHVVGWNAYGGKEYVTAENGFWTVNGDIFQTAEILGIAVDKWLNGELDIEEIQETYEQTLERYTEDKEKENFLNIINQYKNERIDELERFKKQ
jgi:glycosyltransferase involved in cell wall biosynthesis